MIMDTEQRRKIIIISVAVLIILAMFVGGWWLWQGINEPAAVTPATEEGDTNTVETTPTKPAPVTRTPEQEKNQSASRLARLFAERFATFTSQGNFEGIRELGVVTTNNFQSWAETQYIPKLQQEHPNINYTGQTTKVLSVTVTKANESEATAVAEVQQEKTSESRNIVSYTTLTINMVYQNGTWLVDSAYFQNP